MSVLNDALFVQTIVVFCDEEQNRSDLLLHLKKSVSLLFIILHFSLLLLFFVS